MGTQVSSEAAMATQLLLERLRRLSPSRTTATSTVEEILSEVPVQNRERVLAVLEVLSERDPSSRDDALATGARLVLNGARELWGRNGSLQRAAWEGPDDA